MDQTAIKVSELSKSFNLPHQKHESIKSAFVNIFSSKRGYEKQEVLKDLSFEIKKGEFFGIVGRNGSGKSTLLKLLAGVYTPDKGSIQINGRVTPFIELGVGFNPELTGRENVYLSGALFGFNRREMDKMYEDIVSFAELEKFMDQKLKNYSSGMQVRLAFSIAIRAKSEILILDEVLAVGDASFQKKCLDVFRQLKEEKRTIVLVTHEMGNVERFCDRVLVVQKDKEAIVTSPEEASSIYARLNIDEENINKKNIESRKKLVRWGSGEIKIANMKIMNKNKVATIFNMGEKLDIKLSLKRKSGYENIPIECGLAFYNEDGTVIIGPNTEKAKINNETTELTFSIPELSLTPGEYSVTVALYDKKTRDFYDFLEKWSRFTVISNHATNGVVEVPYAWTGK